ncbi:glycosyltransferase family 2 protein [Vibrio fluvialis]|nr:glycosyltransferase family 2 protein [Vibrio fluvialis]
MEDKPLVTVCLTTYSRGDIILSSIRNVLSQDFRNFEVIIIDDNCDDYHRSKTLEAEKELSSSKCRFFYNENNKGLAHNRNFAINLGVGEYFSFKDDDDFWEKEFLSTMLQEASSQKADIVLCSQISEGSPKIYQQSSLSLKDTILNGYTPPVGSQFYYLPMLKKCGGYSSISTGIDHDLWIQLLPNYSNAKVHFSEKVLCKTDYFKTDDNKGIKMTLDYVKRTSGIENSLKSWEHIVSRELGVDFFKHFTREYRIYLLRKFSRYYITGGDFKKLVGLLRRKEFCVLIPPLIVRMINRRFSIFRKKETQNKLFYAYKD